MPHNRNRDYAGDALKLGTREQHARDLDHLFLGEDEEVTRLDYYLAEWKKGWPEPGMAANWPRSQEPVNWVDTRDDIPTQFDKVPLLKAGSGQPEKLSYATARAHAAAIISASPREHRQFEVVKDGDTWSYYFTTPFFDAPRTKKDALDVAAELNREGVSTLDGKYHWVVGAKDTDGYFHIRRERVLEEDEDEDDPKFDPANPLQYETWPDGTIKRDAHSGRKIPIKIDLPDGSSYFVLSDNRLVHSGPPKEDPDAWIESITDPGAVKTVTVGEDTFLVWPDGTKTQVGAKFTGDIKPEDITVQSQQKLKDGTWITILNNGQIFRLGREEVPATVGWDEDLKKFKITQPDGSIRFEEAADPTYDPGLVTISTPLGDRYFFEQRTGIYDELGLPEVPATIETMEGPDGTDLGYGIRGTQGELLPLDDLLDRAIEAAVVNGDMDKAIAFDDFRKRPSRTEALKMALEFARSPADQVLISAISSGETYIAPPPAGTLQRVGPQAAFLQQAYAEFRATLTGGRMPTEGEFQQALAGPPPPEPTELELAQLETANLNNDLLRTQIAVAERAGQNADAKTAEVIAASESKTARDDSTAESKTANADAITTSKISATTGATTTGGTNGGTNGDDLSKIDVGAIDTPIPVAGGLGNDPRLNEAQNEFYEVRGRDTSLLSADELNATFWVHGVANPELAQKVTEGAFDPAVQEAEDKHFADYRAAKDWAASVPASIKNKWGGSSTAMMEAHQLDLAETARTDLAAQHEIQVGALSDILMGSDYTANVALYGANIAGLLAGEEREMVAKSLGLLNLDTGATPGIGIGEPGEGGPPLPAKGGGAETLGGPDALPGSGLEDYPTGVTFEDLNRAIWLQEGLQDVEAKEQETIASTAGSVQSKTGEWFSDFGALEASLGLAGGGRVGGEEVALVGESGPEVALFPSGTEIIPLDRNVKPDQARRLRRRGIRGMQEGGDLGGTVFPLADDIGRVEDVDLSRYGGVLPSGVRRTIAGQGIRPSRGYLSRAAGIGLPSGQALRNMLPEELDVLKDIGAQTGIPERAFERELALGIPSGERQRGSARFLPLSLRS